MKQLTPFSQAQSSTTFEEDFEGSMNRLRGALTDLLNAGGEDARQPQELSRNCGINKNLAWKICKIVNSTDSYEVASQVPGNAGMRILLAAFERRGIPQQSLDQVSKAFEEFEHMIRVHVGDRSNLELYVGSVQADGIHSSQLEVKRRMAYQGNSVIWGVQARVAFSLRAISPTANNPEQADFATAGGLLDFRRLRPTASWPLLRQLILSENVELGHEPFEALDPSYDGTGAPLIREFCSDPMPPTRTVVEGDTTTYEICEGPVGNTAALDITFGTIDRDNLPVRADTAEAVGEHYCRVDTPVELLHFDLLVHRDLPFEMPPQLVTYSTLSGKPQFPLSRNKRCHLPGSTSVQSLGSSAHGFATPHIPFYGQLVRHTCEQIGHPLEDFRGYRVTLSYPPIPSIFVMHHHLGAPK